MFACSNNEKSNLNDDYYIQDPNRPKNRYHVGDSTNYEYKLQKMDSVSIIVEKRICKSKWKLVDFTPIDNDYLISKKQNLDSLIITFSPNGDIFIDRIGIVGQWSLSFGTASSSLFAQFITITVPKESIGKPVLIKRNYRFAFYREDETLIFRGLSLEKGKFERYLFKSVS